jgi:hypothetical protein
MSQRITHNNGGVTPCVSSSLYVLSARPPRPPRRVGLWVNRRAIPGAPISPPAPTMIQPVGNGAIINTPRQMPTTVHRQRRASLLRWAGGGREYTPRCRVVANGPGVCTIHARLFLIFIPTLRRELAPHLLREGPFFVVCGLQKNPRPRENQGRGLLLTREGWLGPVSSSRCCRPACRTAPCDVLALARMADVVRYAGCRSVGVGCGDGQDREKEREDNDTREDPPVLGPRFLSQPSREVN